jgi:hypothetical protein
MPNECRMKMVAPGGSSSSKPRVFTNDSESQHFVYFTTLEDILDEVTMIGRDNQCSKYQLTQIDGFIQMPSGIITRKHSQLYRVI